MINLWADSRESGRPRYRFRQKQGNPRIGALAWFLKNIPVHKHDSHTLPSEPLSHDPVENRNEGVRDSARKIESPFAVDPELCLYSPQDNYDSLEHPRIAEWRNSVRTEYGPDPA